MISYKSQIDETGVRRSVVETLFGKFKGPVTSLTDNEYENALKKSTSNDPNPPFRHPIFEIRQEWNDKLVKKFDKNGFDFTEELGEINRLKEHHKNKLRLYRPDVKPLRENGGISEKANNLIVDLALKGECHLVPAFDPSKDSPPAVFEERILQTRDRVREKSAHADTIPFVRIKDDPGELMTKLKMVADNGFNAVGVEMRSLKTKSKQLDTLRKFSQMEKGQILIYGANVPRTIPRNNQEDRVSARHVPPLYGVDVVGYCYHKNGRKPSKEDVNKTPWRLPNGRYKHIGKLRTNRDETLICPERCCENRHPSDVYMDESPHEKIYSQVWLHDIVTMKRDMERLGEAVEYGAVKEFYEQRQPVMDVQSQIESRIEAP